MSDSNMSNIGAENPAEQEIFFDMTVVPDNILLYIFSFLNHREISTLAQVCRRFRRIASDTTLWHQFSTKRWTNFSMSEEAFLKLADGRFRRLSKLYLTGISVSPGTIEDFYKHCPMLKMLVLGRDTEVLPPKYRQPYSFPRGLKTLDLRGCKGNFSFLRHRPRRLKYIEHLGFGPLSYSTNFSKTLFQYLTGLTILDFTSCNMLTDNDLKKMFPICQSLKSLCLIGCRSVFGYSFFDMSMYCSKMETLLLRYIPINDVATMMTNWERMPIKELDISACPSMTPQGLCRILSRLHHIRYLNMSYCGFGGAMNDTVLQHLIRGNTCRDLEMLDIRWSFYVSQSLLKTFLKLCPKLEYLGIYQSSKVTFDTMAEIVAGLPNLKILEYGPLRRYPVSSLSLPRSLMKNCPKLQVLSLINAGVSHGFTDILRFEDLAHACHRLKRINLCDCDKQLVASVGFTLAEERVTVTEKWECALPAPVITLDTLLQGLGD